MFYKLFKLEIVLSVSLPYKFTTHTAYVWIFSPILLDLVLIFLLSLFLHASWIQCWLVRYRRKIDGKITFQQFFVTKTHASSSTHWVTSYDQPDRLYASLAAFLVYQYVPCTIYRFHRIWKKIRRFERKHDNITWLNLIEFIISYLSG